MTHREKDVCESVTPHPRARRAARARRGASALSRARAHRSLGRSLVRVLLLGSVIRHRSWVIAIRLGGSMGLKTQTKRHQNNTPICFAHLDKCNGIVLACWKSSLPIYGAGKSPVFFSPSCGPLLADCCCLSCSSAGCHRHASWPSLFHMSGCSTNHLGLGLGF